MAPAQIVDITTENNQQYEHKKFQGKRNYAHKKFGTRLSKSPVKEIKQEPQDFTTQEEEITTAKVLTTNSKRSSTDLFRPYALPDNTPRKRKYHELQTETQVEEMDFKRFAPTPSPSPPQINTVIPQIPPVILNPYYRLQQFNSQYNSQTFALILQKQRAALCMGEILKRQANLNLYNLMGQ